MTSLYICYQSAFEPLTETQVVAYLEGLALAGYRVVLLTFEPTPPGPAAERGLRGKLAGKGIAWHWLPYHKRPTAPATAWDVLAGAAFGLRLVHRYKVRLLHARAHVPGLIAMLLQRATGAKFLFDVRGFMAEEYVDAGHWPAGGRLFRVTKRVERELVRAADGFVVLTHKAEALLREWYPDAVAGKPLQVIPCCVDFRGVPAADRPGRDAGGPALTYAGKLGGSYLTEPMVRFVAAAKEQIPGLRWRVWTQSDSGQLRQLLAAHGLDGGVTVGRLPPSEMAKELPKADAGLAFVKPCLSRLASSLTKVGEYLAAGLPVVSLAGVGDQDELLSEPTPGASPVGVLIRELTQAAYAEAVRQLRRLWDDPETPARCRAAAREYYDLEHVGWARYRRLYRQILGRGPAPAASLRAPHDAT